MISMTRRGVGASLFALLGGCASSSGSAPAPTRQAAAIGSYGIDLAAIDTNVKAGDDFFRHVNGRWLATTQIPGDRTRWGTFDILRDKSDREQRAIIDEVAASGGASGTNQQKIADYYSAFLNQDAIDAPRPGAAAGGTGRDRGAQLT